MGPDAGAAAGNIKDWLHGSGGRALGLLLRKILLVSLLSRPFTVNPHPTYQLSVVIELSMLASNSAVMPSDESKSSAYRLELGPGWAESRK